MIKPHQIHKEWLHQYSLKERIRTRIPLYSPLLNNKNLMIIKLNLKDEER